MHFHMSTTIASIAFLYNDLLITGLNNLLLVNTDTGITMRSFNKSII